MVELRPEGTRQMSDKDKEDVQISESHPGVQQGPLEAVSLPSLGTQRARERIFNRGI